MPKLTLYTYWRSSSAYRVRIALGFKGLAYEPIFVNLLEGEQRSDAFVAKSPLGYVPCLVVDGAPFVESVAIIELLEELSPTPRLFPETPEDRARVRALVEIVNAGTQPLQNLSVLEKVGADKEVRTAWLRHFMARGLGAFEALLARYEASAHRRGPYAYGETFSVADAYLVPQVYAARRFGVDLAPFPRVLGVEAAALALPFVASASPEAQPDARP